MNLEIITPEKKLFSGEVNMVQLPGTKGSFEILNNHAPIISTLEKGIIRVKDKEKEILSLEIQGGVIDGIGHSMFGDFTFENGQPTMENFNKYRLIRMDEAPQIEVHYVNNGKSPSGLGEPTLPPAGAAVANAFHSATGVRMYNQPFVKDNKVLG